MTQTHLSESSTSDQSGQRHPISISLIRTLVVLGHFVLCGTLAFLFLDGFNVPQVLGNLFAALLGDVPEERMKAFLPFGILAGEWLALAVVRVIPIWRADLEISLPKRPIGGHPYLNHAARGVGAYFVFVLVAFGSGHLSGVTHRDIDDIVLLFLSVFLIGLIIYDLRNLLFPDRTKSNGGDAPFDPTFNWRVPTSISEGMLEEPKLKIELARDLRARARDLRRLSFYSLTGICLLLFLTVIVIIFAGDIAYRDIGKSDIERAKSVVQAERSELVSLRERLASVENYT